MFVMILYIDYNTNPNPKWVLWESKLKLPTPLELWQKTDLHLSKLETKYPLPISPYPPIPQPVAQVAPIVQVVPDKKTDLEVFILMLEQLADWFKLDAPVQQPPAQAAPAGGGRTLAEARTSRCHRSSSGRKLKTKKRSFCY